MIKACIFDLDGTLAYTLDSMAAVGNQVVRKFGLNPMPVENYRYYCGNGADMALLSRPGCLVYNRCRCIRCITSGDQLLA